MVYSYSIQYILLPLQRVQVSPFQMELDIGNFGFREFASLFGGAAPGFEPGTSCFVAKGSSNVLWGSPLVACYIYFFYESSWSFNFFSASFTSFSSITVRTAVATYHYWRCWGLGANLCSYFLLTNFQVIRWNVATAVACAVVVAVAVAVVVVVIVDDDDVLVISISLVLPKFLLFAWFFWNCKSLSTSLSIRPPCKWWCVVAASYPLIKLEPAPPSPRFLYY